MIGGVLLGAVGGAAVGSVVIKNILEPPLYRLCEFTPQNLTERISAGWDVNSASRTHDGKNYPAVLAQVFNVKCRAPDIDLAYVYLMNGGLVPLRVMREIMPAFSPAQRAEIEAALAENLPEEK